MGINPRVIFNVQHLFYNELIDWWWTNIVHTLYCSWYIYYVTWWTWTVIDVNFKFNFTWKVDFRKNEFLMNKTPCVVQHYFHRVKDFLFAYNAINSSIADCHSLRLHFTRAYLTPVHIYVQLMETFSNFSVHFVSIICRKFYDKLILVVRLNKKGCENKTFFSNISTLVQKRLKWITCKAYVYVNFFLYFNVHVEKCSCYTDDNRIENENKFCDFFGQNEKNFFVSFSFLYFHFMPSQWKTQ